MLELSIRLARLLSQKSLYSDAGAKPLRGYGDGYARRRHRIIHPHDSATPKNSIFEIYDFKQ
jgi:hypothetical protein